MPFSLQVERSDLPVVQNLDFCLIGVPPRYICLILNDTSEGWFGCIMVRCLVNSAIGPAVKLNQDPYKSQFGLSQEKFKVWPWPKCTCLLHGMKLSFLYSQGIGKGNILYTSLIILSHSH